MKRAGHGLWGGLKVNARGAWHVARAGALPGPVGWGRIRGEDPP